MLVCFLSGAVAAEILQNELDQIVQSEKPVRALKERQTVSVDRLSSVSAEALPGQYVLAG